MLDVLVRLPRAVDPQQRRADEFAAQALVRTIVGFLLWNAVFLGALSVFASFKAATIVVLFLLGTGFALVLAFQKKFMNVAVEVRTLAVALTIARSISRTRSMPSWEAAIGQKLSITIEYLSPLSSHSRARAFLRHEG